MNYLKLAPICGLIFPTLAYADTNNPRSIYDLDLVELMDLQLVIAASGFEQKASKAPATITVITHQQWQARGARHLADVLAAVPGFHSGKPQIEYNHTRFIIRGLAGEASAQIKLLIDGEPFEFMQNSGLFVGLDFPLTGFERLEVVKGPGSAIYGADAFGGIINLVSFEHNKMPALLGVRTGSFNTHDIFGRADFNLGDSHFQWSFDYSRSDDDDNRLVNGDLQSTLDEAFATTASNAPGRIDDHYEVLSLLAKWQWQNLDIDYMTWRNFDVGLGGGIAQALDTDGHASIKVDLYKLSYDLSEWVSGDLTATVSYKQQKGVSYLKIFPSGAVLPIGADGNADFANPVGVTLFEDGFIGTPTQHGYSTTTRLTHLLPAGENHLLRWELGYEDQNFNPKERKNFGPGVLDGAVPVVNDNLTDVSGTPFSYLPNTDRYFYYLSLQDEWQLNPDLQLTLGLRYDDYSDFGSSTNPRLGLIWQASDAFTLKVFAGSAFRAPPISQLYVQNNPVATGNSELRPETVDTLETGFNFEYFINQNAIVSLNLFEYHAKDLIVYVFDEQQQANIANNFDEQKGRGGEFGLKYKPLNNLTLDLSYSRLLAQNQFGTAIADVPKSMATVGMNWQIDDNWQWNIQGKWIADRTRTSTDLRPNLPDYTLVNSRLQRSNIMPGLIPRFNGGLNSGLSVSLTINNVFDKEAREPSNGSIAEDYPLQGRQLLFEVSYRW